MGKAPSSPAYCPACGGALPGDERYAKPLIDDRSGDGLYDIYCPSCTWSGDIWPDSEQGIHASDAG